MTAGPKVSFVVAGAQKSGTSALDAYLREHRELCLPSKKELHFFDNDRYFTTEPIDYAPYHRAFELRPPQRLLGEVTPAYIYWPTAPERIARYNPAMKMILVLRNPITRAFSQWNMARELRGETLSFLDAVKAEPQRLRTMPLKRAKRYTYVDRGFYAQQLKRLWLYITKEQTLAFKSEELSTSPASVLAHIADFLGVEPFRAIASRRMNVREYGARMTEEERRYLVGIFEPDIRELESLLGWDCSRWLD